MFHGQKLVKPWTWNSSSWFKAKKQRTKNSALWFSHCRLCLLNTWLRSSVGLCLTIQMSSLLGNNSFGFFFISLLVHMLRSFNVDFCSKSLRWVMVIVLAPSGNGSMLLLTLLELIWWIPGIMGNDTCTVYAFLKFTGIGTDSKIWCHTALSD